MNRDNQKDIDLSSYSVEQLNALIDEATHEIARKEKSRLLEIRNEMKRLADNVDMTVEAVLDFEAKDKKKQPTKSKGTVKYQNPVNPKQTWAGKGKQPNWLKEALEKGAHKEDFLIERS